MANLIRENIDRWFENNLDVDNRTLFMGSIKSTSDDYESGVDNFMAEYFIKGMHVLEHKNKNPIIVIFFSIILIFWFTLCIELSM